jgi:4-alpha-glucanotransferase
MSDEALRSRARAAGLAVDWIDAGGHPQSVGSESLKRLLEALPEALPDSGNVADVPPLVTGRIGVRTPLPGLGLESNLAAELALEDGNVLPITLRGGRSAGVPPVALPGYHRLRFADREVTLAVAPPRCLTLEEVGGGQRMWGVAAQIYSLRREGDGGIGDAGAVRDLAQRAAAQGADAVALSPVHSLFASDPARCGPYSPSSRLFLNPLCADPCLVFPAERVAACRAAGTEGFEHAALIDWQGAGTAKFTMLHRLFEEFRSHDLSAGGALAADFERFVEEGGEPLQAHARFEALHAERPAPCSDWPAHGHEPADKTSVQYHLFLQWVTGRSFAAAQAGARDAGMRVGLLSDLAIGMDRHGSHAWSRQSDLLLDLSIGAPPDIFNPQGQDWGLTGFSPAALVARGFEPFLATVRAALRHAGGVRIDHAMGLMRLWLIPRGASAAEGAYLSYPLDDLLNLLALESRRHGAVVIGEDLGTVPSGFRARLRRAGIAGMDVLWFERSRQSFKAPARWRRDAVALTTTHDLPTVAGWWSGADIRTRAALGRAQEHEEADRKKDRVRLWRAFSQSGAAEPPPPAVEDPDPAVDAALTYVAQSPSTLMLVATEDLLGLAEQPNLPGTVDEHPNWRRRLPPLARDLFEAPAALRRAKAIDGRRS